jgi:hypothetical protein
MPAAKPWSCCATPLWAYARRETMELLRDPIRLSFAFIGPLILVLV